MGGTLQAPQALAAPGGLARAGGRGRMLGGGNEGGCGEGRLGRRNFRYHAVDHRTMTSFKWPLS